MPIRHLVRKGTIGAALLTVQAALLLFLSGCAAPAPDKPFTPPRAVTCADSRLLGFGRGTDGFPASLHRYQLNGFSVARPDGPDWCVGVPRTQAVAAEMQHRPLGVIYFAKNLYAGEQLGAEPARERRSHTFLLAGFLLYSPKPHDLASLIDKDRFCGQRTYCRLLSLATTDESRRFSAPCLGFQWVWSTKGAILHERGIDCIHPSDPRFEVRLVASEYALDGKPFYTPPLIDRLQREYQPFLDSLTFSPPQTAK